MGHQKIYFSFLFFLLLGTVSVGGQDTLHPEFLGQDDLTAREKVEQLSNLCWQNREKNPDKAIEYAKLGIEMAQKHDIQKALPELHNFIGVIYQHYKFQIDKAIPHYHKGLQKSLQNNDSIELGYVYNNLGDAFYKIGNVPLASEYAEKSMSIFKKIDDKRGIAYSHINKGYVKRIDQELDSALHYFNKAIELRKTFNDSVGIASATLEVARTYNEMGLRDEAMKYFRKSLELHEQINNIQYTAYSHHGIGDVYFQRKSYDSAISHYRLSLQLHKVKENPSGVVSNLLGIAMVYAHSGDRIQGEEMLNRALTKAKQGGLTRNILDVLRTKADFYDYLQDYKKASEHYRHYIRIYDSLYSEQQYQTLQEIKNRFQITEELSLKEKELDAKQNERIYFFIIIILLLLLAAGLVMRYIAKEKMRRRLVASSQSKDKVFSIISHDLKSPFNALIGFSEVLGEDLEEGEYDDAKEHAQIIHRTSKNTFDLITNLLNWARAQRGKIQPDLADFDVRELLDEIHSMLSNMAESKSIDIEINAEASLQAYADKNLTRTILTNLANNALKFTHANGLIILSARREQDKVLVSVADNGIGIPSDTLPKLFRENESVTTWGTNREKGTGLGLLVCKELVELQGGKIWVESEEDKGSTFYFTILLGE
ncbi:MAG: tetratricopeptide repeat-containing sensor histidine kinase [Bacteroidales bacterium]|nr:tetratricopeptide repeat-containing sensor histidine kinase [Bacteroidales bacterium]MCF8333497.1 tetratricopeptide repeat-containing sensor histidine kinase [Bacteroidales bacterium]